MINSPWNSTVLRQYKTDPIVSELSLAKAMGGLVADGPAVVLVTPNAEKVPPFMLPITSDEYASRKLSDQGVVYMDGRSFMRREQRSDHGFIVANQTQADFVARLGELTALWVKDPSIREDFLRAGDLAPQTYIAWLSGLIANKMGVDLDVTREIQIITGLFYFHQFTGADQALSPRGKDKAAMLIQRWTRAPIQLIQSIVSELEYMCLLEDYVAVLKSHFASNTRISQVNMGFIVMSLGRSWFGFGAQEIAGCAIEYPPAFLSLVEAAANAKVWRKTHLGQLVQRIGAGGRLMEEFSRSMEVLAGQSRGKDGGPARRPSFESHAGTVVSDADIKSAEEELGLTFCPDYVQFLRTYGVGVFGSHEICGLGKDGYLNVVFTTQAERKYLKPDRYVIENTGIDSKFVVADARGTLYIATPTGEKPMGTTFGQYLKDVLAGKR